MIQKVMVAFLGTLSAGLFWMADRLQSRFVAGDMSDVWAMPYISGMRTVGWITAIVALVVIIRMMFRSKRKAEQLAMQERLAMQGSDVMMSYEKIEPLTQNDRRVVLKEFRLAVVLLLIFSLAPLTFLLFVDDDNRINVYLTMAPWMLVMALLGARSYNKSREILNTGTKNVIRGIVTDRYYKKYTSKNRHIDPEDRSTTSIPHLKIGDRALWVSNRIFSTYKVGDAVELHYCETGVSYETQTNIFLAHVKIQGAGVDMGSPLISPALNG